MKYTDRDSSLETLNVEKYRTCARFNLNGTLSMRWKRLIRILIEAVYPSRCLVCRDFLARAGHDGYGQTKPGRSLTLPMINDLRSKADVAASQFTRYFNCLLADSVCATCRSRFSPVHSPLCTNCGLVFQSAAFDDHQCGDCIRNPKRFGMARAFGIYDYTLMELIHGFKYRGKMRVADAFGAMMLLTFLRFWKEDDIDLIIPVPLHRKRFRKRGFNQAYFLVKAWEEIENRSLRPPPVERDILLRQRWTEPQTGLGRRARITNIKDAFRVHDAKKIRHRHILLVDDVYTTGATVDECSKVLLAADAKRVDVLTLARAL